MDQSVIILMIAISASLAVWAIAQIAFSYFSPEKNKIQQRLSSNWRPDIAAALNKPLTISLEMKEMPAFLARSPYMQRLYRKLVQAYPEAKLTTFLSICAGMGLASAVLVILIVDSFTGGVFAGLCGMYMPIVFLNGKRARRQRALNNQLPEALDFLARILRAGHSLSTGLQMMGDELKPPIKDVFRRCYDQHSLGVPLEQAMREMASRVDSGDFAFFVTAWWVGLKMTRNSGSRLRDRLKGNLEKKPEPMSRKRIGSIFQSVGEVAASPLMPKTREEQYEMKRRLARAGVYAAGALRVIQGMKVILS